MKSLSISFTLGKESHAHSANISHNNRDFKADNIDGSRTNQNYVFKSEDPEKVYEKLFGKSLAEYNAKQRKSRKIKNYFEHILCSKKEEAFYEAIVQYGDKDTASCGSKNGQEVEKMLAEFLIDFEKRNKNLYVFNAVMHLDEATPHLHIDFIPFYTKGRKNGLSKGVSFRSAIIEEGFSASNSMQNQTVAWEESERNVMEKILNNHGFVRDNKHDKHIHMNVADYKTMKDEQNMSMLLTKMKNVSEEEKKEDYITNLKEKMKAVELQNKNLLCIEQSDLTPCYYSSADKFDYVTSELDQRNIQYHTTPTGFEIKKIYLDQVREIEKKYKPVHSTLHEQLRSDIDRLLIVSNNFDDLLSKLEELNYTIKKGKYISVRPENGERFIRLKSLGEFYSELALNNQIAANHLYESKISNELSSDNFEGSEIKCMLLKSIQIYTVAVKKSMIPLRKKNVQKPFSWKNDAEIDKLISIQNKINSGYTLATFKHDCEIIEEQNTLLKKKIESSEQDLKYFENLKKHIDIVFNGASANALQFLESQKILSSFKDFQINANNYNNIDILIENEKNTLEQLSAENAVIQKELGTSSEQYELAQRISSGIYVQTLAKEEKIRQVSDLIPKGFSVT